MSNSDQQGEVVSLMQRGEGGAFLCMWEETKVIFCRSIQTGYGSEDIGKVCVGPKAKEVSLSPTGKLIPVVSESMQIQGGMDLLALRVALRGFTFWDGRGGCIWVTRCVCCSTGHLCIGEGKK